MKTRTRCIEWRYFQWSWVTPNYPKPPHFDILYRPSYLRVLIIVNAFLVMANHPSMGRGQVTLATSVLVGANHISRTAAARVVKFHTGRIHLSPSLRTTNHPKKGRGEAHMTHFWFQRPQSYFLNGWNDSCQILYTERIYQALALGWQSTHPLLVVVRVSWPIFLFYAQSYLWNWWS